MTNIAFTTPMIINTHAPTQTVPPTIRGRLFDAEYDTIKFATSKIKRIVQNSLGNSFKEVRFSVLR